MNKIELKDIREAVEEHEKEDNVKKLANAVVTNFKAITKEQKKESEDDEKVRFFLKNEIFDGFNSFSTYKIPFETTKRGLRELKRIMNEPKERRRIDLLEELIEEMDNLAFYDGVILVWDIFDRIVDDYFDDDDKDSFDIRYKDGLLEKMQDILENEVLNKIQNQRKSHLHDLFLLKSNIYKRPAWMRNKN